MLLRLFEPFGVCKLNAIAPIVFRAVQGLIGRGDQGVAVPLGIARTKRNAGRWRPWRKYTGDRYLR
jgi:hypothetical protein